MNSSSFFYLHLEYITLCRQYTQLYNSAVKYAVNQSPLKPKRTKIIKFSSHRELYS